MLMGRISLRGSGSSQQMNIPLTVIFLVSACILRSLVNAITGHLSPILSCSRLSILLDKFVPLRFREALKSDKSIESSSAVESHTHVLTDPNMSLSTQPGLALRHLAPGSLLWNKSISSDSPKAIQRKAITRRRRLAHTLWKRVAPWARELRGKRKSNTR